jgi:hypothetical protein
MATTLWSFEMPVTSQEGRTYSARVCGREREDHLWEGWIEFEGSKGEVLRSGRETTQPNFTDIEYWAQGLTPVYLEGALRRAIEPPPEVVVEPLPTPTYSGPARRPQTPVTPEPEAILDPYSVYQQGGSELLLEELSALRAGHLRQIIRAYLSFEQTLILDRMDREELIAFITQRVRVASHSTARQ